MNYFSYKPDNESQLDLVKIGVINPAQQIEYITTIFRIPKNYSTLIFMMGIIRLNQQLVLNLSPLSRKGDMTLPLKLFQYVLVLYLSIVYYNIHISPKIIYMISVVTWFVKLRYNRLPMVIFKYRWIFKAKLCKRLGAIKAVKIYIDNILFPINDSLTKNTKYIGDIFW